MSLLLSFPTFTPLTQSKGFYVRNDNYLAAQKSLSLTDNDIYQLAKNSFLASFIDENLRVDYLHQLDKAFF